MKKSYDPPKVLIQKMYINNFAAGACGDVNGVGIVNTTEDTCVYVDESSFLTFFSYQCQSEDGFGVDIVHPNPQSPFAQLCYHRPLDALSFFNS